MSKNFDSVDKIVGDIISEAFCLNIQHDFHVPIGVTPEVKVSNDGKKKIVMKTNHIMVESHKSHRSRTFRRI